MEKVEKVVKAPQNPTPSSRFARLKLSMMGLRVSCRDVWSRRSPGCSVSSQAPERKASDDVQCEDRSGANIVLLGDFRRTEAEDCAWHCTGANERGLP